MTNRGTARRMKITLKEVVKPVATREGSSTAMLHKERHPNDKGIRREDKSVNYGKGKSLKLPKWKTYNLALVLAWDAIYNAMEIGDACPKCVKKGKQGTIIWKGATKHRPLHPRCNNGCVLVYSGDEDISEEEE